LTTALDPIVQRGKSRPAPGFANAMAGNELAYNL